MCLLNWHEITVCFSCFQCYFFIIEIIASLFILNTTSGYDTYSIFYCILIFPLMWAVFPCVFSISVLCTKADTSAVPVKCEYLVYCFITCLSRLQEKNVMNTCCSFMHGDKLWGSVQLAALGCIHSIPPILWFMLCCVLLWLGGTICTHIFQNYLIGTQAIIWKYDWTDCEAN